MRTQSGRSAWSGWGTSVSRCPGFPADVVDGLVVHHEGAVGVLEGGVVVRIELYGSTTAVDTQRVASGHQSLLVKNLIETSVRTNRRVRRRSLLVPEEVIRRVQVS